MVTVKIRECDGASMSSDSVAAQAPEKCLNIINGQKRISIKKLEDDEDKLIESVQALLENFDESLKAELDRPERPIHHDANKTGKGKFTDYEAWRVAKEADNKKRERDARKKFITSQRKMDDTYYRNFKQQDDAFADGSADAFMKETM